MDNKQEKQLELVQPAAPAFADSISFEHSQRVAKMLASSSLIPKEFQGNLQNVMIALEMANRIGASPLMVMQNLYLVHGKPSWSSTFIVASINSCGKFSPLRYHIENEGTPNMSCYAWAYDKENKEKLCGPVITMEMAQAEGWVSKSGSKWKTMPGLMIRYRAAAFFGRLYAPEITMGMQTEYEVADIVESTTTPKVDKEAERLMFMIQDCATIEDCEKLRPMCFEKGLLEPLTERIEQLK